MSRRHEDIWTVAHDHVFPVLDVRTISPRISAFRHYTNLRLQEVPDTSQMDASSIALAVWASN